MPTRYTSKGVRRDAPWKWPNLDSKHCSLVGQQRLPFLCRNALPFQRLRLLPCGPLPHHASFAGNAGSGAYFWCAVSIELNPGLKSDDFRWPRELLAMGRTIPQPWAWLEIP